VEAFGTAVRRRREQLGLSQAELARQVPIDRAYLSRIEGNKQHPSAEVAVSLDVLLRADGSIVALAPMNLGSSSTAEEPDWLGGAWMDEEPAAVDVRVTRDQQEWIATRKALNGARPSLARLAASLYPDDHQIGDTGLLAHPD
jgi:transcriptional regulator with XRE-family HTH domain